MEIKQYDVVLCEFYFSNLKTTKKRPVLVFKDNLPYDDFIAMAISSQIENLQDDEVIISNNDFQVGGIIKTSKVMIRKTFIVSKKVVIKKYGTLKYSSFIKYYNKFCNYFKCKG